MKRPEWAQGLTLMRMEEDEGRRWAGVVLSKDDRTMRVHLLHFWRERKDGSFSSYQKLDSYYTHEYDNPKHYKPICVEVMYDLPKVF